MLTIMQGPKNETLLTYKKCSRSPVYIIAGLEARTYQSRRGKVYTLGSKWMYCLCMRNMYTPKASVSIKTLAVAPHQIIGVPIT